MDNKYFTPSIEDIRVGYECEIFNYEYIHADGDFPPQKVIVWKDIIIDAENLSQDWRNRIFHQTIRVPYLTKEQIEAEGWKDVTSTPSTSGWGLEKDNRFAVFKIVNNTPILQIIVKDPSKEELVFGVPSEHFRFICPCKDINTFRYICKLLNI